MKIFLRNYFRKHHECINFLWFLVSSALPLPLGIAWARVSSYDSALLSAVLFK